MCPPITSLENNLKRERKLIPQIVLRTWHSYTKNINIYKEMFGDDFVLMNNDTHPMKKLQP